MLDSYFKISERGSTVGREVRGGFVTFFTMAYIVALNPLIIGLSKDADGKFLGGGDAPNLAAIAAATALIAGVLTILMGVAGNFPLALATGLGLNTFVAVSIASQMSWADAMGLVVLEGIIITILVLTGFRKAVFSAVPAQLKIAISVGIGLFIALIGLVDAGFVRRPLAGPVPVMLGDSGTLVGWPIVVFCFGLLLMIGLMVKKVKGAILIAIGTPSLTIFLLLPLANLFYLEQPKSPMKVFIWLIKNADIFFFVGAFVVFFKATQGDVKKYNPSAYGILYSILLGVFLGIASLLYLRHRRQKSLSIRQQVIVCSGLALIWLGMVPYLAVGYNPFNALPSVFRPRVAGKLQALASWLACLIVNKGRLPIHAENANPALI